MVTDRRCQVGHWGPRHPVVWGLGDEAPYAPLHSCPSSDKRATRPDRPSTDGDRRRAARPRARRPLKGGDLLPAERKPGGATTRKIGADDPGLAHAIEGPRPERLSGRRSGSAYGRSGHVSHLRRQDRSRRSCCSQPV